MKKPQLIKTLKNQGFSKKILSAFKKVKRENFVSTDLKELAYENNPLPIGKGQTISQPYTIAFMLNLLGLKNNEKILEIGSGSGYVLALINEISKNSKIYGVEIIKELVQKSKKALKNYKNIKIKQGNALKILKKQKFDRITISAAASEIPRQLFPHLNENGILVCPVKNSIFQIKKIKNKIKKKEFYGFVFVPLISS